MINEKNNLIYWEVGEGQGYTINSLTKKEQQQIDREIQYFQNKADKHGFITVWDISEIRALSLKSPYKGKWMTNGVHNDVKVELPNKRLTGIELWRAADELYKKLGDTDHRFIEEFTQNGDTIEVFFGS